MRCCYVHLTQNSHYPSFIPPFPPKSTLSLPPSLAPDPGAGARPDPGAVSPDLSALASLLCFVPSQPQPSSGLPPRPCTLCKPPLPLSLSARVLRLIYLGFS